MPKRGRVHFASLADIAKIPGDVRFTPGNRTLTANVLRGGTIPVQQGLRCDI